MKLLFSLFLLVGACTTQARTYQYDEDGRLMTIAYPSGEGIAYSYDGAGNLIQVEALILPSAPSDLAASRSGSEVVLTWIDNSNNETGFLIYRREDDSRTSVQWQLAASLASNTLTYTDTDTSTQAKYEYRVVATSTNGPSADSNIVEAIDSEARPFEFTDQAMSLMSEETIELTLTLTTQDGSVYRIEESTDLIRWENVTTITGIQGIPNDQIDSYLGSSSFLGHPDDDTTTVTIEVPGSTERKFFRPVRN